MSVATTGQHNLLGQILRTSAGTGAFGAGGELQGRIVEAGRAAQQGWGRLRLATLILVVVLGLALAW